MNEAQKRLYKKLLKNIEAQDEDDALEQMALAKETPAEAYARKLALERKDEGMMRAKAERRLAKKREKEEEALRIKIERQKKKEVRAASACPPPPPQPPPHTYTRTRTHTS